VKFAFLVHPLDEHTQIMARLGSAARLRQAWGRDISGVCQQLQGALRECRANEAADRPLQIGVADELKVTAGPAKGVEGRLYEIPLHAAQILADPDQAMEFMEQAVDDAARWGAKLVGLGSMTGIIGGGGQHLAERGPLAATTGNSLTVYAALQNLFHVCSETDLDLSREVVAVVGVPGSIATAVATLLAPHCGRLLLVARQRSSRVTQVVRELGAELMTDISQALGSARVIVSATSSGNCIDQRQLLPGALVVDVAVPTDVKGAKALRDDILIVSGGLSTLPDSLGMEAKIVWVNRGIIPSCLGETLTLALENRAESFSLGRLLDVDKVQEIGGIARSWGIDFNQLVSFGLPLTEQTLVQFRKTVARRYLGEARQSGELAARRAPSAAELAQGAQERHSRYINPVLVALNAAAGQKTTFAGGKGCYLIDAQGDQYLDFVAGFGSLNLGHNHPEVVDAVKRALTESAPGFTPSAVNPYAPALAEKLITLAPGSLEMVFFTNSGSESVEAALKLARISSGRTGIVYAECSYHGKSFGSLSVTGNANYQRPFGPLLPDCESVPFGDLAALERALAGRRQAAFIVEPIQAEGGMRVPPANYLREAQELCRQTGTLLIVDEVQTGLGRTGKLFAVEHELVEPDILTLAKSLGGGVMPLGAMLCRRDLWMKAYGSVGTFALHTSTFGGGSLACAAGLAALRVLVEQRLTERAAARGNQLLAGLQQLCRQSSQFCEVRGRGLLLGLEFNPLDESAWNHWRSSNRDPLGPYLAPALDDAVRALPALYAVANLMSEYKIFTQIARSNPLVLRVQPPLVISDEQVRRFLQALDSICGDTDLAQQMFGSISKTTVGQHHKNGRLPQPTN
jgi:3-acetyloctanal aminotransferase